MIGTTLNQRFTVESELGRGGMGVVYRAHDTVLERQVAVKALSQLDLGSEGRDKLLREAQSIAKLNHPNIVAVHDAGEADGVPFIVMELVEGENLHDGPPEQLPELVRVASHICAALEHAHANGIVHRDLKPENVLIDRGGAVKLMDFGIARSMASRLTSEGEVIGTVFYLAPETALGQEFDGRADLYSLGVMLYELTTGDLPFADGDPLAVISQHLRASVVPPRAKNADIPPRLDRLIVQLLSKAPGDRPASAAEVRRSLERPDLLDPEAEEIRGIGMIQRIVRGRFVGREQELSDVRAIWNQAVADEGQTLLISGAPGIGKTRLMRELATHVEVGGGTVLVGECEPQGGAPYAPFAQIVRRALRGSGVDGPGLPEFVLSDLLKLAPDLKPFYPDIPPNPPLEPEAEQQRLFENVVSFCRALSERAPLLLVIDDAHWADSGSLALWRHLARRTRRQQTLIAATYREVELDSARPFHQVLLDLNRKRLTTRLKLKPLTKPQSRDMLAAIFEEEITSEFLDGIHDETEGNPFFIEEVCKALVEAGKLYYEDGRWHRPDRMEDLEIPQSVRVAIQSRIEKLPVECQETLSLAATIGREFDFDTLAEASEYDEDTLIEALEAAERAQLIEEVGADGNVTLSFVHALTSATIRDAVHTLRRRKLHRQIAAAIESLRPDDAAALAYHYGEAGDEGRALKYHTRGGRMAAAAYAHAEAEGHFRRALELHPSAQDEAELLRRLGEVLTRRGRHAEAIEAWRTAVNRYRDLGETAAMARCYARMGRAQSEAGDMQATLDLCLEGMQELADASPSAELAALLHEAARAYYFMGMPDEARPLCGRALEMARRARSPDVEADVLATLGILADQSIDQSIEHLEAAIALAREHGLLHRERRARNNLGFLLWSGRGDPRASLEQDLENIEIDRRTRDLSGQVWSFSSAAGAMIELGELLQAAEMLERASELHEQLIDPGASGRYFRTVHSHLLRARGEVEDSLREVRGQWKELIELDASPPLDIVDRGNAMADRLFELGEFAEAGSILQRVVEAADRARRGRAASRSLYASVKAKLREAGPARILMDEAKNFHRERRSALDEPFLHFAESCVLVAESRWEEASTAFRSVVDSLEDSGLRWRRAWILREWAKANLDHGQPEGRERARGLLEDARSEFEAMGATGYVKKITRRLSELPAS